MRLNAKALGFTLGVLWGLAVFLVTIGCLLSERTYGKNFLYVIASVYPGFSITSKGAWLGLCYGFVDGFVFGLLIGWLYNFFVTE